MSTLATTLARIGLAMAAWCAHGAVVAQAPPPAFDAELARSVGADELGMRPYVLVILKTGPSKMPDGERRNEMFKGHFANINRLAAENKLVLAGPLDGVDGWRGLFVLAVRELDEAKQLVASDPVIAQGEMVAEYHRYYGSAALMVLNDVHAKLARKKPGE